MTMSSTTISGGIYFHKLFVLYLMSSVDQSLDWIQTIRVFVWHENPPLRMKRVEELEMKTSHLNSTVVHQSSLDTTVQSFLRALTFE